MTVTPYITVVMSAFNAADHIRPALESLIAQDCPDWELILVDDGSTDGTETIARAYAQRDERIRYHQMAENSGISKARNAALDMARGDWITLLDSDDVYAADRLQTLLDRALGDRLDIVADNIWLYDEAAGAVLCPGFAFLSEACLLTRELLAANDGPPRIASLGHLKPFIRRSLIEQSGTRYAPDIHVGEDFHFLFNLLGHTQRAVIVRRPGYRYTLPFSATSGARSRGTRTAYGPDSLDDLALSNRILLEQSVGNAPENRELLALLRKRGKAFRDEHGWRHARQLIRSGRLMAAMRQCANLDISFVRDQLVARYRRYTGVITTRLRGAERPDFTAHAAAEAARSGKRAGTPPLGSLADAHDNAVLVSTSGGGAAAPPR